MLQIADIHRPQELWASRSKPTPLFSAMVLPHGAAQPLPQAPTVAKALGLANTHAVWSLADNARVFLHAVQLFLRDRANEVGAAVFDKDDAVAVEVVASAANLRAASYGIPTESLFAIKVCCIVVVMEYIHPCPPPGHGWQHHSCHCNNQRDCERVDRHRGMQAARGHTHHYSVDLPQGACLKQQG